MANSTKGNLLPNTVNTPLDARARVATLADVANIQNPELGGIFYCVETGKHYKITALASKTIGAIPVENAAVGSYEELVAETGQGTAEITEVSDNIATLAGTNVPVGVRTNSGAYYPIEKGSIIIDLLNSQIKLDVSPYLAYDNAASFAGPWTVYYAAGSKGDKGNNALSFQIGTVTTLAAGTPATATATVSAGGVVTLNLGIPKGADGATGGAASGGGGAVVICLCTQSPESLFDGMIWVKGGTATAKYYTAVGGVTVLTEMPSDIAGQNNGTIVITEAQA